MRSRCSLAFVFLLLGTAFLLAPRPASAHPLDQLNQNLTVTLQPNGLQCSVAAGGGILANELVLSDLDANGDGTVSTDEQRAWVATWAHDVTVTLDGTIVPLDPAAIRVSMPPVDQFHLGQAPLLIDFTLPLPTSGPAAKHLLAVRNEYLPNRSNYRFEVTANNGTEILDKSWPGPTIRLAFTADPSVAPTAGGSAEQAAREWGKSGVLGKARRALEHPKTPLFLVTLLGIFALMGALHAMQPGHGKTLVAAYLVATGGTPRDAFLLAGVVTLTHTVSVFALGLATLAATELFLPSKVIPVMGALSGLLVAAMGLSMLWRAFSKLRRRGSIETGVMPEHSHEHDGHHHHHHNHAGLTDDEHARIHLEEALALRPGVSRRNLITLGISGGMAPCPDALAILLLAIGMNEAGLGMVAILAFSFGLAAVLVAFGLAISLIGPAWRRSRRDSTAVPARLGALFGRIAAITPLFSGGIVLLLGIAMAVRSLALG